MDTEEVLVGNESVKSLLSSLVYCILCHSFLWSLVINFVGILFGGGETHRSAVVSIARLRNPSYCFIVKCVE